MAHGLIFVSWPILRSTEMMDGPGKSHTHEHIDATDSTKTLFGEFEIKKGMYRIENRF